MSKIKNLIQFLVKKQLATLQSYSKKIKDETVPVVVVVGTVGKSSTTMLINQLFAQNGYKVISGTTQAKNLNSLTGMAMTLGGFYVEMSTGWKPFRVLQILLKSFLTTISPSYDLSLPTAIVLEVGYDYQGESEVFLDILDNIDLLVVSSCTWEHNQGFNDKIDQTNLSKISSNLPDSWQKSLNDNSVDGRLRNIAIEQMNLTQKAQHIILPQKIGEISNTILTNIATKKQSINHIKNTSFVEILEGKSQFFESSVVAGRNGGTLTSGEYIYNPKYLLPETFARNSLILESTANCFELDSDSVQSVLSKCELPFGRFGFFDGKNNTKIVDSTYNSDPASLNGFLDTLEEVINNPTKFGEGIHQHTLVLGEMRELGQTALLEHKNILVRLEKLQHKYSQILEVVLIGTEWLKVNQETRNKLNYKIFEKSPQISQYFKSEQIKPKSWFWIKGSQNTIFLEVVVKSLLENPSDSQFLCRQEPKWDELR